MKNFIIPILVAGGLLIAGDTKAQEGFSFSLKATPQFSSMENKDDNNNNAFSRKTALNGNAGIGIGYNFTSTVGVGADAVYSFQGRRYELDGSKYYQKNAYVKVPVYFTYNTDPSKWISFIGKLGPQVSFLADSKLHDNDNHSIKSNTKSAYKSVTYGGMALAGTQFRMSSHTYLTTAWRFDGDFTNAEETVTSPDGGSRAKSYNLTSGLEVGVKYVLGR